MPWLNFDRWELARHKGIIQERFRWRRRWTPLVFVFPKGLWVLIRG